MHANHQATHASENLETDTVLQLHSDATHYNITATVDYCTVAAAFPCTMATCLMSNTLPADVRWLMHSS